MKKSRDTKRNGSTWLASAVIATTTFTASPCRVQAALVGYWPFDETSGAIAHDASPHRFDGGIVNIRPDTWASGIKGGAIYLPGVLGSQSTRVVVGTTEELLNPTTAISFSAWVWTTVSYDQPIFCKESPTEGPQYWFGTFFNSYGMLLADNSRFWSVDDRWQHAFPGFGQWTHLCGTWDGTTVQEYYNGVPDPMTQAFYGPIYRGAATLTIGVNSDWNFTAFTGLIDELYLFDHALSPAEVTSLYELTYVVPEPSHLALLALAFRGLLARRCRRGLNGTEWTESQKFS